MQVTEICEANDRTVSESTAMLRAGKLVAFPTDTVFGVAADARQADAVAKIFAAKGRAASAPLPVMVASLAAAETIGIFNGAARKLAVAFWPGALTIVVPLREPSELAAGVTAGLGTVALRIPDHPVALAVLEAFGGPLAVTSANISGAGSTISAAEVASGLGQKIALVLDGPPSPSGHDSTIVGIENSKLNILRQGKITARQLAKAID